MPSSSRSAGFSSRGLISTKFDMQFPPGAGRERPEHILARTKLVPRGEAGMAYSVPDLTYAFDALEPHIDARTMEIHHDKHHVAYVTNLNAALEGSDWMDKPIDEVLRNLDAVPEDKRTAVRNNGGGHANHTLFWEIMGPNGGGDPSGALGNAISEKFGGLADLKSAVNDAGVKRFGSGWTWLVWDGSGLAVESTPNQDTPVMDGKTPLLGIDVWEHAYYLNYQNRRPDYLEAWWNVVDWDAVSARFDAARG
jgi:Fe-Mn family superoxide dismutase